MKRAGSITVGVLLLLTVGATLAADPGYKMVKKIYMGGEGGWDYLTFDSQGNRLFIAHNKEILVVDAASEQSIRATLARDPWHETHLVVDSVDRWTVRLDGRTRA